MIQQGFHTTRKSRSWNMIRKLEQNTVVDNLNMIITETRELEERKLLLSYEVQAASKAYLSHPLVKKGAKSMIKRTVPKVMALL